MGEIIYLDNNATTPVDPRVLEAMLPYFSEYYANPASTHHFGTQIHRKVELAREQIATLINAKTNNIILTSGATEAINLAIKGLALSPYNDKKHIVTVGTEHKAVLDTCAFLESVGFAVTYLPVDSGGLIDHSKLEKAITPETLLVSVMLVNNETGVIQDINSISKIAHSNNTLFMCDATQGVGKMPVDVLNTDIDLMAFSAHKFYGPKGIGALYINSGRVAKSRMQPIIHGGGHEQGLRSGTLNAPAIIGFGKACEIAMLEMADNAVKIQMLRDELEAELLQYPGSFVNGNREHRLYNTTNICFPGIDATVVIGRLKNYAMSNGSACTAALVQASHVLKSMGNSDDQSLGSIRLSLNSNIDNEKLRIVQAKIISTLV